MPVIIILGLAAIWVLTYLRASLPIWTGVFILLLCLWTFATGLRQRRTHRQLGVAGMDSLPDCCGCCQHSSNPSHPPY